MSRPLIYVDTSEVRDGALTEVKTAIGELARHVERASPQVLAYDAFFSADGTRMTVVHLHADAESLDQFTQLAGPRFARFRDLLTLRSIDVYGQPSATALHRLEEKARLLGDGHIAVHAAHAGFSRLKHQWHATAYRGRERCDRSS
jgi:hypothetical protein